jgi:hypothetical protein
MNAACDRHDHQKKKNRRDHDDDRERPPLEGNLAERLLSVPEWPPEDDF